VSTPLSTNYFCAYQHGEVYGLNHDTERFSQSWLQVQTKVPGLYLTGQDVLSCGVVGAMMAGCITSIKVLGASGLKLAYELFAPKKKSSLPKEQMAQAKM
jgi:all-trans-retinol 13,14-reductase